MSAPPAGHPRPAVPAMAVVAVPAVQPRSLPVAVRGIGHAVPMTPGVRAAVQARIPGAEGPSSAKSSEEREDRVDGIGDLAVRWALRSAHPLILHAT